MIGKSPTRESWEKFKALDTTRKGAFSTEWETAFRIYEDCSRDDTAASLQNLGSGLAKNPTPIEVGLLRRIIDRLAVVYGDPPTRWFERSGVAVKEDTPEIKYILDVLTRARYNLVLRRADRLRALLRQVVIRVYPSDALGSCVLRVFEPFNVSREYSESTPDTLDGDRRVALRLSGASKDQSDQRWEVWTRTGEVWTMQHTNGYGDPLEKHLQPMRSFDAFKSPYTHLPAQIIYDDEPAGRAWLPPRFSRTAWNNSLNAMANDLWALVHNEAHSQTVVATDDTKLVPKEHGPGTVWVLPKEAVASILNKATKLSEAQNVLDNFVRLWTLSEDLPATEFDRSKQQVTGASLKVQLQPLIARRNDMVPLAREDERMLFERFRAVHNVHVASGIGKWKDQKTIAEDLKCCVEIADINIPTDAKELQDAGSRSIMMGTGSVIDQIQAERRVSREDAIKIYARVKQDLIDYPPHTSAESLMSPGGQPPNTEKKFGTNSMVKGASKAGQDVETPED